MKRKHVANPFREPERKAVDVPTVDGKEAPGLSRGITPGKGIYSGKQGR